eukprot:6205104-Pleurochrysis_carterae.AAC.1
MQYLYSSESLGSSYGQAVLSDDSAEPAKGALLTTCPPDAVLTLHIHSIRSANGLALHRARCAR